MPPISDRINSKKIYDVPSIRGKTISFNFDGLTMRRFFYIFIFSLFCLIQAKAMQPFLPVPRAKKMALTFDACMTSGMLKKIESGSEPALYNAAIVDFLRSEKIAATFFITGLWAEKYPNVVKALAAEPLFEIGNHSYSHRGFVENCFSLPNLPEKEKAADIRQSQEILFRLTGKKPALFRFPGGCFSPADQALVKTNGLSVVGWSFASGDAFNSNTTAIVENVLEKAKSGAIVVFHLSGGRYAPKSAEVLKIIVPELKKRGFEFVTVSTLLRMNSQSAISGAMVPGGEVKISTYPATKAK